jgi:hypothetical protein
MAEINEEAKPGSRVYLASYLHYWLRSDLLQCASNSSDHDIPVRVSAEQLWLELYERGFQYLFIDKYSHAYLLEQLDISQPPKWVNLIPKFSSETLYIYKLKFERPPSTIKPATCERLPSSRIWKVVFP